MDKTTMVKALVGVAGVLLLALGSMPAHGQTSGSSPLSNFVLAGYGSTTYSGVTSGDFTNNFTASVSPVLLYSMGNDILFETELEFGLSGQVTTTSLEYAQIDYLGFERIQIVGGKFLLPFGVFSERLHPTWINKMPSSPPVYGHAHGGVVEGAVLPILSDAGLMIRWKAPLGSTWAFDVSGWVSQGPRLVTPETAADEHVDDHAHAKAAGASGPAAVAAPQAIEVPLVGFGVAFSDNNKNKMLGARIGLVHGPSFEVFVSGFHAMYDEQNFLDIAAGNVAVEWRRGPMELRGEALLVRQEFELADNFEWMTNSGYYLQAARRVGRFEPVLRWGHLLESKVQGDIARSESRLLAVGLNYWIDASIPVKVAYEIDFDGTDRIMAQWAFGF